MRIIWVAALTILLLGEAHAQQSSQAIPEVSIITGQIATAGSAQERRSFVTALANYCDAVKRVTPTNTPREADWVASEGKSNDPNRLARLWGTTEFARQQLADFLTNCQSHARFAAAANEMNASRSEAAFLVLLALGFEFDALRFAPTVPLDPQKFGFGWFSLIRQQLLRSALKALEATPP